MPPAKVEQASLVRLAAVGRRAGPDITPCPTHKPGPNWIPLNVGQGLPEVPLVQRTRVEAVLPQVAAAPVKAVDVLGVQPMGPAHGLGQRLGRLRRCHEMNVISHQAIPQYLQAETIRLLLEYRKIHMAIIINEEHILSVVASLSDMVRAVQNDCSGYAWHRRENNPLLTTSREKYR